MQNLSQFFISKASIRASSFFLSVQLSQPYVITGHTSAFISLVFVEIGMLWLFHIFCSDAPIACPLLNLVRNSVVYGILWLLYFAVIWSDVSDGRAVTESINHLIDVCTVSAPGQKECDNALRQIQVLRSSVWRVFNCYSEISNSVAVWVE